MRRRVCFRKLPGQSPSPAGLHPQPGQYGREDLVASEQIPAGQGEIRYLNLVERLRHGGGGLEAEEGWCLMRLSSP